MFLDCDLSRGSLYAAIRCRKFLSSAVSECLGEWSVSRVMRTGSDGCSNGASSFLYLSIGPSLSVLLSLSVSALFSYLWVICM